MKVNFIRGKIPLNRIPPMTAIVCPTDNHLSGTGALEKIIRETAGPELAARLAGRQLAPRTCLVTNGYQLHHKFLIHVPVPHFSQLSQDPKCLQDAYSAMLRTSNSLQHGDVSAIITHIATPLLGTGSAGWDYSASMSALWQAVLDLQSGFDCKLQVLDIYYPEEAQEAVASYLYRTSQAFFSNNRAWSTWGESRLWLDLMRHFDNPNFNRINPKEFVGEIQRFFHNKTGKWLCGDLSAALKEYSMGHAHGTVGQGFARRTVPVLVSNLVNLGYFTEKSDAFLIPVTMDEYALTLPYELLPLLTHLRSDGLHMNETIRNSLDFQNLYFVTIHHHKYFPDLIDYYSLDVEEAHDRHYRFSAEAAQTLVRYFHEHPRALIRGMKDYLKYHGGPALEKLVRSVSSDTFSY